MMSWNTQSASIGWRSKTTVSMRKKQTEEERQSYRTEPMWFYDEIGETEEWQSFRMDALPLEREYLEIRALLRDTEAALRDDPENNHLQAQVKYLKKRLEGLERQAPWISSDVPIEVLLWGVPHG